MLFLLEKLDNNFNQVGILYSCLLITRAVLEIPSGVIADSLGRKGSLLFSFTLYIFSFALFYFSGTFGFLFIPIVFYGIGDSFRTGTHKAMIIEYLTINNWSDAKTQYYGHTRSWSKIGSSLSVVIATIIKLYFENFEAVFLFSIIPYLTGFILITTYPNKLNGSHGTRQPVLQKMKQSFISSFTTFRNYKQIKRLFILSYLFGFHRSVKDYIQPIIFSSALFIAFSNNTTNNKQSVIVLGALYFIIYILSSISSRNAYRVQRIFKSDAKTINVLALTGIATGLLISLSHFTGWNLISGILFIPLFASVEFQRPTVINYISRKYDNNIMATVLSVESQLGSVIGAILAFLAGFIAEKINLSYGIGCIAFISLIFILFSKIKD